MIVSKKQLQRLIDEEFSRTLQKRKKKGLNEGLYPMYKTVLAEVPAEALLAFAKAYSKMGWAVIEQFEKIMQDPEGASANVNALEIMRRELGGTNSEIDEALDLAWAMNTGEDPDGRYADRFVESKHSVGDVVVSGVDAQKLKKGERYIITGSELSGHGMMSYRVYYVEPEDGGPECTVINGDLLLRSTKPESEARPRGKRSRFE